MIDRIYIEDEVADHPRTRRILDRFPRAARIPCARHTEIFNPHRQNFRLQKRRPALILARKPASHVLPVPPGYGLGDPHNYYFSHMLNCLYDCRYCFLQGMFRSAHYLLFVNYEDFFAAVDDRLAAHPAPEPVAFFSGYDCDSLALESVTAFADECLPFFAGRPRARLELRTKSLQLRPLLARDPLENVVVAFSLTPQPLSRALEPGVPPLGRRLAALADLQRRGWPVGLRFDPLFYVENFRDLYADFFAQVFAALDPDRIHSVTLGPFRLPRPVFKRIDRLFPDEPLFASPLTDRSGTVSYPPELEQSLLAFVTATLRSYVPDSTLFPCGFEPPATALRVET